MSCSSAGLLPSPHSVICSDIVQSLLLSQNHFSLVNGCAVLLFLECLAQDVPPERNHYPIETMNKNIMVDVVCACAVCAVKLQKYSTNHEKTSNNPAQSQERKKI